MFGAPCLATPAATITPDKLMITARFRWTKNSLVFAGTAAWGLLLVSCVMTNRSAVTPPNILGANFVGSAGCIECHEDVTDHFADAPTPTSSRAAARDKNSAANPATAPHPSM